ncbi:MAG: Fic family protein [Patescibacteria group bacterium]
MIKLNQRENKVIEIVRNLGKSKSSDIHKNLLLVEEVSLVTVKRLLSKMESEKILVSGGIGRSTAYSLNDFGKLISSVDASVYCQTEPDKRNGAKEYNYNLFENINFYPFLDEELKILTKATNYYKEKIKNVSETIHKKELERFIIELSWKSSKIEGNTYTLLDTENLISHGIELPGHKKEEALMILNHKKAFDFIYKNRAEFKELNIKNLESIHSILIEDLNIKNNIRSKPVGVLGSIYKPLDNQYQIREAVENLAKAVSKMSDGYAKALVSILGISYIQPFEDGNKRTGRLFANAMLLAYGLPPLSYRSVDEKDYREAVLVFYELNSLIAFKKIFITQYDFSARNYLIS